ncbi:MAG: hypothetical protein HXM73_00435 [Mogibacterium diversum]|nr:hypothetical protein [Mogibacterium diversum]MBF1357648.1 hypothetical protein [Mogibacterium diversum]MBF1360080.1 hypothetical protein [Mogibacterium diversum]
MGRISKFRIKNRGRIGIAFILSVLLIIAVALTGCDSAASKENSNAKKHKQTKATSTDAKGGSGSSDSSSSSSAEKGSDKGKSKDKSKDKEKDKSKKNEKSSSSSSSSTSSSSSSSSSVAAKHKVWVPEQGHYEQKKVFKCRCGREFNSPAEQAAHRNEYIAEKRKTDPNFECKGDHLPKGWVTRPEWKVDVPGHYEYR